LKFVAILLFLNLNKKIKIIIKSVTTKFDCSGIFWKIYPIRKEVETRHMPRFNLFIIYNNTATIFWISCRAALVDSRTNYLDQST